ncbi:hypothetical protein EGW08_023058, partial [Elysia chlorotica]
KGRSFSTHYSSTKSYYTTTSDGSNTTVTEINERKELFPHPDHHDDDGDLPSLVGIAEPFGPRATTGLTHSRICSAILTLWHLIFFVGSLGIAVAGVALRFYFSYWLIKQVNSMDTFKTYNAFIVRADENKTHIIFTGYPQIIGTIVILCHLVYSLCHLLYITNPWHRCQFTLPTSALITGFVVLTEISTVNILLSPDIVSQNWIDDLKAQLRRYKIKSENNFIISYNYVSVALECCGITDRWDFQDVKDGFEYDDGLGNSSLSKITMEVAPTCCIRDIFKAGVQRVVQCAHKTQLDVRNAEQYNKGCYTMIVDLIQEGCMYYSLMVWVHLLDVSIHATIYKERLSVLSRIVDIETKRNERKVKIAHS